MGRTSEARMGWKSAAPRHRLSRARWAVDWSAIAPSDLLRGLSVERSRMGGSTAARGKGAHRVALYNCTGGGNFAPVSARPMVSQNVAGGYVCANGTLCTGPGTTGTSGASPILYYAMPVALHITLVPASPPSLHCPSCGREIRMRHRYRVSQRSRMQSLQDSYFLFCTALRRREQPVEFKRVI